MKYLIFFALSIFLVTSCLDENSSLLNEISDLETQFDDSADGEIANQLITKYEEYVAANPDDLTLNPRLLYRQAGIYYRLNKNNEAIEALKSAIKINPEDENVPNAALLMANILEKNFHNEAVPTTIYQALSDKSLNETTQKTISSKLKADTPDLINRLTEMQGQIFNDSLGRINYRVANDFIQSSQIFAYLKPGHPQAVDMAMKAAETARTIRTFPVSIEIYQYVYNNFPSHPKAGQAMFLHAFTLDNDLKQFEEARLLYETFLAKYPTDEFADDTQFLLENLGKDDAEIIKSFTQEAESTEE